MVTTDLFKIDGLPMCPPDSDMSMAFEDIDSADSGRDESAVMHRIVVRQGVGKWEFSYTHLTREEYAYMESLFYGKADFIFTYHNPLTGGINKCKAYRSKHSVVWHSARTNTYRNYQFSIIAC